MFLTLTVVKDYINKNGSSKSIAVFGPSRDLYTVFSELGRYNKNLTYKGKPAAGWIFRKDQQERIERIIEKYNNKAFNEKEELVLTKILDLLNTKRNTDIESLPEHINNFTPEFIKFVISNNIKFINTFMEKIEKQKDELVEKKVVSFESSEEEDGEEEDDEEEDGEEEDGEEEVDEEEEEDEEDDDEDQEKGEEDNDEKEEKNEENKEKEKEEEKKNEKNEEKEEEEKINLSSSEKIQFDTILELVKSGKLMFDPETITARKLTAKIKIFIPSIELSLIKKMFTQDSPLIDLLYTALAESKINKEHNDKDLLEANFVERRLESDEKVSADEYKSFSKGFSKIVEIEQRIRDKQPIYRKEMEEYKAYKKQQKEEEVVRALSDIKLVNSFMLDELSSWIQNNNKLPSVNSEEEDKKERKQEIRLANTISLHMNNYKNKLLKGVDRSIWENFVEEHKEYFPSFVKIDIPDPITKKRIEEEKEVKSDEDDINKLGQEIRQSEELVNESIIRKYSFHDVYEDERKNYYLYGYLVSNSYLQSLFNITDMELASIAKKAEIVSKIGVFLANNSRSLFYEIMEEIKTIRAETPVEKMFVLLSRLETEKSEDVESEQLKKIEQELETFYEQNPGLKDEYIASYELGVPIKDIDSENEELMKLIKQMTEARQKNNAKDFFMYRAKSLHIIYRYNPRIDKKINMVAPQSVYLIRDVLYANMWKNKWWNNQLTAFTFKSHYYNELVARQERYEQLKIDMKDKIVKKKEEDEKQGIIIKPPSDDSIEIKLNKLIEKQLKFREELDKKLLEFDILSDKGQIYFVRKPETIPLYEKQMNPVFVNRVNAILLIPQEERTEDQIKIIDLNEAITAGVRLTEVQLTLIDKLNVYGPESKKLAELYKEAKEEVNILYGKLIKQSEKALENDIMFLRWFLESSSHGILTSNDITKELNIRKIPTSSWYYFLLLTNDNKIAVSQDIISQYEKEISKEEVNKVESQKIEEEFRRNKELLRERYESKIQAYKNTFTKEEKKQIKTDMTLVRQGKEMTELLNRYISGKRDIDNNYVMEKAELLKTFNNKYNEHIQKKVNLGKIHIGDTIAKYYRAQKQNIKSGRYILSENIGEGMVENVDFAEEEIDEIEDDALGEYEQVQQETERGMNQVRLKTNDEILEEFTDNNVIESTGSMIYFSTFKNAFDKWLESEYPNKKIMLSIMMLKNYVEIGETKLNPKTNLDDVVINNAAIKKIIRVEKVEDDVLKTIKDYVSLYDTRNKKYLTFNNTALKIRDIDEFLEMVEEAKDEDLQEDFLDEYAKLWKKYKNPIERSSMLIAYTRNFLVQKTMLLKNPLIKNPSRRRRRIQMLKMRNMQEKISKARMPKYLSESTKNCMFWISEKPWLNINYNYILIGDAYGGKKDDFNSPISNIFSAYDSTIEQNGFEIQLYKPSNFYNYTMCKFYTEESKYPVCDLHKDYLTLNLEGEEVNLYTVLVSIEKGKKHYYIMNKNDYDKECDWWRQKKYSTPVILNNLKNMKYEKVNLFFSNLNNYMKKIVSNYVKRRYNIDDKTTTRITDSMFEILFQQYEVCYTILRNIILYTLPFNRLYIDTDSVFESYNNLFNVDVRRLDKSYLEKIFQVPNEIKFPEVFLHPDSINRAKLINSFDEMINREIDRILIDVYNITNPNLPQLSKLKPQEYTEFSYSAKPVVTYCKSIKNAFSENNNVIVWRDINKDEIKTFKIPTDRFFIWIGDFLSFLNSNLNKYKILFTYENDRFRITNKAFYPIKILNNEEAEQEAGIKNCGASILGFTSSYEIINTNESIVASEKPSLFNKGDELLNKIIEDIPTNRIISVTDVNGQIVCLDMKVMFDTKMKRIENNQDTTLDYEFVVGYLNEPVVVSANIVDIVSEVILKTIRKSKTPILKDEMFSYFAYDVISQETREFNISSLMLYKMKEYRIKNNENLFEDYNITDNNREITIPYIYVDQVHAKIKQKLIAVNAPEISEEITCDKCKQQITNEEKVYRTFEQMIVDDQLKTTYIEFCSDACFDKYKENGEDHFENKLKQDLIKDFIVNKSEMNNTMRNRFLNIFITRELFKSEEDFKLALQEEDCNTIEELIEKLRKGNVDIDKLVSHVNIDYLYQERKFLNQLTHPFNIFPSSQSKQSYVELFVKFLKSYKENTPLVVDADVELNQIIDDLSDVEEKKMLESAVRTLAEEKYEETEEEGEIKVEEDKEDNDRDKFFNEYISFLLVEIFFYDNLSREEYSTKAFDKLKDLYSAEEFERYKNYVINKLNNKDLFEEICSVNLYLLDDKYKTNVTSFKNFLEKIFSNAILSDDELVNKVFKSMTSASNTDFKDLTQKFNYESDKYKIYDDKISSITKVSADELKLYLSDVYNRLESGEKMSNFSLIHDILVLNYRMLTDKTQSNLELLNKKIEQLKKEIQEEDNIKVVSEQKLNIVRKRLYNNYIIHFAPLERTLTKRLSNLKSTDSIKKDVKLSEEEENIVMRLSETVFKPYIDKGFNIDAELILQFSEISYYNYEFLFELFNKKITTITRKEFEDLTSVLRVDNLLNEFIDFDKIEKLFTHIKNNEERMEYLEEELLELDTKTIDKNSVILTEEEEEYYDEKYESLSKSINKSIESFKSKQLSLSSSSYKNEEKNFLIKVDKQKKEMEDNLLKNILRQRYNTEIDDLTEKNKDFDILLNNFFKNVVEGTLTQATDKLNQMMERKNILEDEIDKIDNPRLAYSYDLIPYKRAYYKYYIENLESKMFHKKR